MRLALFASGGGSNARAILQAIAEGRLDAEAAVVVTDRTGIGALDLAEEFGLPTAVIQPLGYPDRDAFGEAILDVLAGYDVDTIVLAGYLKLIPAAVVTAFSNRIVNVHPSLLPSFGGPGLYGRRVHKAVLDAGCRVSGATIHLVDAAYDTGPILLQDCVPVEPDDTPESLARRVLAVEHRLFPEALQLLATGRVSVSEGRAVVSEAR